MLLQFVSLSIIIFDASFMCRKWLKDSLARILFFVALVPNKWQENVPNVIVL